MTEFGTKRQRYDEQTSSMTPSERTESLARRHPQGRLYPSIFSANSGEFFAMNPITLMRRFTEDLDRVFSSFPGGVSRGDYSEQDFAWMPEIEVRQSGNNL